MDFNALDEIQQPDQKKVDLNFDDPHEMGLNDIFAIQDPNADEESQYRNMKDAVIFLVDASKDIMLRASDQGQQTLFDVVTEAMTNFMKTKIITNENDRIGLIFYNTVLRTI